MQLISASNLLYLLIPIFVVGYFYFRWVGNKLEILYASARMLLQLLLVGYLLAYLFEAKTSYLSIVIIIVMISAASLITLRNITHKNLQVYKSVFVAIFIGGSLNLVLVIYFVLDLDSFSEPRYVIPIAGMLYANCMNAVSLVAERFEKESQIYSYEEARAISFRASLIPQINSFLAVGLVSLPGMMTGQILAGTDPIVAVRYQIMVMFMVLGSSGISTILYLLQKKD
ncbi:MAG TPA: ABC transporter permease [Sulfurospirillum arcachonense]|nr:ABC transporter permease [Sulfurospirillum arcachonense]HIP45131.1 ABC transporter permease [Sulfurospirillum arcachonense]